MNYNEPRQCAHDKRWDFTGHNKVGCDVRVFQSSDGKVWKYVFKLPGAITESVLYKYPTFEDRTVICTSVQSGCPVGCTFCGTGKNFLRNLSAKEIIDQPRYIIVDRRINPQRVKKLQIMFMSMGEPFLNYRNVERAIQSLQSIYPNAQLLLSTMAPRRPKEMARFLKLSKKISAVGLQLSVHKSSDESRDVLIPFDKKLKLAELRDYGIQWWHETGRRPYINYCVDGTNDTKADFNKLRALFPPNVFNFTFSVICSKDECMRHATFRNIDRIQLFRQRFMTEGYDTRTFDPAGQDDIGGGCGQLWYVQQEIANHLRR